MFHVNQTRATLADLHAAATHVSQRLSEYDCEEAGFLSGTGIPHAFCGSWQVRAMSEHDGEGYEASCGANLAR